MADRYLPSTSLVQLHRVGKGPLSEATEGILVPGVVRLARECIVDWVRRVFTCPRKQLDSRGSSVHVSGVQQDGK